MTALSAQPGQVLLYEGHYPAGVFVVLSGALDLLERHAPHGPRLRPGERPLVLPDPRELDLPVRREVRVAEPAELLFVPRRAALLPAFDEPLASGELEAHSLQDPAHDRAGARTR